MKMVKSILYSFRDLLIRFLPDLKSKREYKFAFLVHPRNVSDVFRKYPGLKILPKKWLEKFLTFYWPVTLSKITGLKSINTGKFLDGFIITIPLTARQMMENKQLALRKIIQATKLAEKLGARLIGLGGLTSSLSKGGLDLLEKININVTTGHAYTAYNVTQTFLKLVEILGANKSKIIVAVVGAAGSVGSTSAKLIARAGFNRLILIDLERKKHFFADLINEIKKLNPNSTITTSHQIQDIKSADFIITATNAPEATVKSDDLKSGAVVIDDAQPSDVAQDVLIRSDVLVVEAGVVHTPDILSHFNFNLKDKHDNFCCLAEVLILAAHEWDSHYVVNRASLQLVDEISAMGKKLNFRIGEFQNFLEKISNEKIDIIRKIVKKN